MIDLTNNLLEVPGNNPEPIEKWDVYFVTIEGTFDTLTGAQASCDRTGQPRHTIVPVPVAVGHKTFEVWLTAGSIVDDDDI